MPIASEMGALKLSGVAPGGIRSLPRAEQQLCGPPATHDNSDMARLLSLPALNALYRAGESTDGDMEERSLQRMHAISVTKRKNDSGIDLPAWMPETLDHTREMPGYLSSDTLVSPLTETFYRDSDMAVSFDGKLGNTNNRMPMHENAGNDVALAQRNAQEFSEDESEVSSDEEYAPDYSGDEGDGDQDGGDDDYTESGRSKRGPKTFKRRFDGKKANEPKKSKAASKKQIQKRAIRGEGTGNLLPTLGAEYEIDGIPYVDFSYTKTGKPTHHRMRIDIEGIEIEELPADFKRTYCIYPKAMCNREAYTGTRWLYESECNKLAWKLVFRNPGNFPEDQRGLRQRAVDVYRNISPETKSRRVQRQVKNSGYPIVADAAPTPEKNTRSARPKSFIDSLPQGRKRKGSYSSSGSTRRSDSLASLKSPREELSSEDETCTYHINEDSDASMSSKRRRLGVDDVTIYSPTSTVAEDREDPMRSRGSSADPLPDDIIATIRLQLDAITGLYDAELLDFVSIPREEEPSLSEAEIIASYLRHATEPSPPPSRAEEDDDDDFDYDEYLQEFPYIQD